MESNAAALPLTDRLWTWFEANKKLTLYVVLGVIGIAVVIWSFAAKKEAKETEAGSALTTITTSQLTTGPKPDSAAAYLKVANEYPDSSAGPRALLLGATTLFVEGKYDEAKTQFDKFTRQHRDSPLMGEALLGIAACLDAQGKTNEATTAYKDIVDRHPNEPFIPQAKFSLARLYENQGKPDQARRLYEEVERADPFLGPEAGMRIEEIKAKYPNLTPPVPIPTNAPIRIEKGK